MRNGLHEFCCLDFHNFGLESLLKISEGLNCLVVMYVYLYVCNTKELLFQMQFAICPLIKSILYICLCIIMVGTYKFDIQFEN